MSSDATCWTVIEGAAAGHPRKREEFARRYLPVVRAYLGARWREAGLTDCVDDAVQEVFLTCFKAGGALGRVDPERRGGFRAFFYGVVRNIALRVETRGARPKEQRLPSSFDPPADEEGLSRAFDRAWALALLDEADERYEAAARQKGDAALRRVELLRRRFQEDLPIREIAQQWNEDPARLHKEYARAREQFRATLVDVVGFHHPSATRPEAEEEGARLLALLK